jgi:hypothetical protein
MENNYTQLEVLLMTGTTFASGNLCEKEDSRSHRHLTEKEKLEEACWNGLLQTMLPEICSQPAGAGALYLWQIKEAASFLELDLGEVPAHIDSHFSITPHSFLATQDYN